MRKRTNAKKPAEKPRRENATGDASSTPAAPAMDMAQMPLLDGAGIVAELESKLSALRSWHGEATEKLDARKRDLDATAKDMAAQRLSMTQERIEVDMLRDAVADDRAALDEQCADFEATRITETAALAQQRHTVQEETEKLARLREELEAQRAELTNIRGELDEEWASVGRVRRAEDALVKAWEAERERAGKGQLRLVTDDRRQAA